MYLLMLHFRVVQTTLLESLFVKKFLISLFLIISFLPIVGQAQKPAVAAPKPDAAPVKQAYEIPIVTKTLPNGLQVIVLQDPSVPLVTVELAVRNGSFTEPPELNGLSHLFEHMFFKANHATSVARCENMQFANPSAFRLSNCDTELKLKAAIKDVSYLTDIDQLGVTYNGTTQEEVVEYYFSTTSPNIVPAMKLIKDAVRFPLFDENEFAREKQVVIGELDRHMSEPGYYLNHGMLERLFYK